MKFKRSDGPHRGLSTSPELVGAAESEIKNIFWNLLEKNNANNKENINVFVKMFE